MNGCPASDYELRTTNYELNMPFANPHMLWALLVIPALVVLRLLLPRRLRVMTAVLGLWRAAAEKLATRGRTHPARSDVLLAVLLLAAALLILAGAGLQWSDVREEPVAITILLDGSPSMSAREDDGQTRLQIANDIVRDVNESRNSARVGGFGQHLFDLPCYANDFRKFTS